MGTSIIARTDSAEVSERSKALRDFVFDGYWLAGPMADGNPRASVHINRALSKLLAVPDQLNNLLYKADGTDRRIIFNVLDRIFKVFYNRFETLGVFNALLVAKKITGFDMIQRIAGQESLDLIENLTNFFNGFVSFVAKQDDSALERLKKEVEAATELSSAFHHVFKIACDSLEAN